MPELSAKVLARARRMEEKHAARRDVIVAAAKSEFAASGLSGTTMRGIASAAGMTTGSIYPYFATKDELYGKVLEDTLVDLQAFVSQRMDEAGNEHRARAAMTAFFEFYETRPDDLALGLYLYDGIGRSGLNPELDVQLNAQLRGIFDSISDAYKADGHVNSEQVTANGVSHAVGLLVMERTGRLKLFGQTAKALFQASLI
ncbi:TetR/AcrR family transcriptional regulator [Shimia sp. CNT1-13L.2]|uniref:TetR/AcrR family transcriptional regulator n=1 Tax=Shimia sp. CNT1-13L.2 TaxID=2959663 RepID=UPI0020CFB213|nr:TetR/AcrR family transcriptional regulator [Shimia sp. CNT1-13L.2]MCP9484205.1 TetR/AcrR family transcriptional regulator [Shimia sp. CNT1-13L.2]